MHQEHDSTPSIPKPLPIFVHGVQNYAEMVKQIQRITEQEQYITKILTKNIVKINCATPETYKKWSGNLMNNTSTITPLN
jgi:hypothetical protein